MPLAPSDTAEVFDAATLLAADPSPSITEVVTMLRSLVPSLSVSFTDVSLSEQGPSSSRHVMVPVSEDRRATVHQAAFARHVHEHPLLAMAARRTMHGALRFSDLDDEADILHTTLYRTFYAPLGIRYQMVAKLPGPDDVAVGYSFNRTEEQGEFSDRDVAVVNALQAHLALHHRRMVDQLREQVIVQGATDDRWVVATIRPDGVVDDSTAAGTATFLRPGERVPDALATAVDSDAERARIEIEVGPRRWLCLVQRTIASPTVVAARPFADPAASPDPVAALVAAGLTRRQAEVAAALATGGWSNRQLAEGLGISEATVKKHLESIFRTLGVDNRTAVVTEVQRLSGGADQR